MCVPSYSVCLKGPQEKCVCCWHSPFNIVWIFHQDPSPVTRALCFQTCLYIPCVCACACVCTRVCLQRHYRHLFSSKCSKLSIPLPLCTLSDVCIYIIFLCIPQPGNLGKSIRGFQALDWTSWPLTSSVLCARDPDTALNAGQCRLLTKLGETQGGWGCFVCLKEVHTIKNSLPCCQCITIKNSWAGLLSAFSHVQVDSFFVPLSCHNSPFTAALCCLLCAAAITEAKSAS